MGQTFSDKVASGSIPKWMMAEWKRNGHRNPNTLFFLLALLTTVSIWGPLNLFIFRPLLGTALGIFCWFFHWKFRKWSLPKISDFERAIKPFLVLFNPPLEWRNFESRPDLTRLVDQNLVGLAMKVVALQADHGIENALLAIDAKRAFDQLFDGAKEFGLIPKEEDFKPYFRRAQGPVRIATVRNTLREEGEKPNSLPQETSN